ncbi:MAG: shikimate dehydrogenase [Deltaproteobacteria bacterium]|nr:shikimate dehydrogenase [Deltaproteobacteria bacterium]
MKVFGLISDGRAFRSKSPAMHSRILRQQGLEGVYLPFAVEPHLIGQAIRGLRALNLAGANVTVPYKEKVIPHLDALSEEAAAIGAVNTIVPRDGLLEGHNTDARGFSEALQAAGFQAGGKKVLVLGTGGAAKAVLLALGRMGPAQVALAGRNQALTAETARRLGAEPGSLDSLAKGPCQADLVINATSVSSEAESPQLAALVKKIRLPGCRLVFDLNYGRPDNLWQALAQKNGASFSDGLALLAHQARLSFFLWTGIEVKVGDFLAALGLDS